MSHESSGEIAFDATDRAVELIARNRRLLAKAVETRLRARRAVAAAKHRLLVAQQRLFRRRATS